jgi:hypothetical protein
MRPLVAFVTLLVVGWLWWSTAGLDEPLPVELVEGFSFERICEPLGEAPRFGEFFWDEVRRSEPALFSEALERCSRCAAAPRCEPVISVASWYSSEASGSEPTEKEKEGGRW